VKLQTRCGTLECSVGGEGSPAIVLFNGAGMTLDGWRALYPAIEDLGTVVAWNRFGIEGSDPPERVQSGAVVVASVRELLKYAAVEPPYVLVGHSLGALYAEMFARLHPGETAGVMMIAPADPARVEAMDLRQLTRALGKVQSPPEEAFRDNLHAEVEAVRLLSRELEGAGPFPDVPIALVQGQGGHFPQLTQPQRVLDELAALVRRARQACAASLSLPQ
jgi:pimeloyl-ACP methyl ester carboxylesterase